MVAIFIFLNNILVLNIHQIINHEFTNLLAKIERNLLKIIVGSKCVLINLSATILDFVPIIKKGKLPKAPYGLNISVRF